MCVSILVCVLYNIAFVVVIVCVYLLGTTLCRLLAFCVTLFEIDNNNNNNNGQHISSEYSLIEQSGFTAI